MEEIIQKEVVNDYFTAGIKAEVILDMLLRPVLEKVLNQLLRRKDQGERVSRLPFWQDRRRRPRCLRRILGGDSRSHRAYVVFYPAQLYQNGFLGEYHRCENHGQRGQIKAKKRVWRAFVERIQTFYSQPAVYAQLRTRPGIYACCRDIYSGQRRQAERRAFIARFSALRYDGGGDLRRSHVNDFHNRYYRAFDLS